MAKKKAKLYYAVTVGRIPGMYDSWTECQKQVHEYSGAKQKKFDTKEKCIKHLRENGISVKQGIFS